MIDLSLIVTAQSDPPEVRHNRSTGGLTNHMLELGVGGVMIIPTEPGDEHLKIQRSLNARIKWMVARFPTRAFVSRTLQPDTTLDDGTEIEKHSLGIFRIA